MNAAFCAGSAASSAEDGAGVWAHTIGESRPKATARAKWLSVRFIGPPDRAKGARRFPTIRFVFDTAIEGDGAATKSRRMADGAKPSAFSCFQSRNALRFLQQLKEPRCPPRPNG